MADRFKCCAKKCCQCEKNIGSRALINYRRNIQNPDKDVLSSSAICLQNSHIRERRHEFVGKLTKYGKLLSVQCSYKTGLREKLTW